MADKQQAQRSQIMKAIKSVSKLEELVSTELWRHGIRYRRNVRSLFGQPDIAIKKYKLVIFIDSCFWHYCPVHGHTPLTNLDYWEKKIHRNIKRDILVNSYYSERNWHIIRIWEHEIRQNFDYTIQRLIAYIDQLKAESACAMGGGEQRQTPLFVV